MKRLRSKLSYANVMATIAVFIALGGAAYAAGLPKNSVGSKQIKNNAVTGAKIKKGAVTRGENQALVTRIRSAGGRCSDPARSDSLRDLGELEASLPWRHDARRRSLLRELHKG